MNVKFDATRVEQLNNQLRGLGTSLDYLSTDLKDFYSQSIEKLGFSGTISTLATTPNGWNVPNDHRCEFESVGYKLTENLGRLVESFNKFIEKKIVDYRDIDLVSAQELSEAQSILDKIDLL